jgi:hypothetical protein
MPTKRVELLVMEGCPNVDATLARVREVLSGRNMVADLAVVCIGSDAEAAGERFLGYPTVRIDGVDVEEAAAGREHYGLQCRVYSVDGRVERIPLRRWIETALDAPGQSK